MPRSTRRILLNPFVLLLIVATSCSETFGSRQTECAFPTRWEGTWFQSGVRQPILLSGNILSSKGRCLHNEGDKFLLVDEKSCYRCVVIHEKHSNVLQYKETYCHNRNSLASLCSYITGDALLYSMFREEALAVPCPFRGPMTFTYNRGRGTCSSHQSNVDTCTDDSRLLFKYQACPDVPASESAVEELECLATWKEGSSRYLVGRLHHGHSSSNEDRYRCFVYERAGQSVGAGLNRASVLGMSTMDHDLGLPGGPIPEGAPEIYRVAQSGDATCNGLFSAMEGSRTMTLTKVSSPSKCRFPSWLTGHTSGGLTWHTLDLVRSYTFHPRNASLHVTRLNASSSRIDGGAFDSQDFSDHEEQDVKILCNSIKQTNPTQTMSVMVAHFTVGCRSGFMCMAFYRRDGHVVEVQTGSAVSRPEEACSPPHYMSHSVPYLTLVTSSPEPRQCPYLGKFTVTDLNRNQRNTRDSRRNVQETGQIQRRRERDKVRHSEDRRGRKLDFETETRRANNEYLVHERQGRRTRSDRSGRNREDNGDEDGKTKKSEESPNIGEILRTLGNSGKIIKEQMVRDKRLAASSSSRTKLRDVDRLILEKATSSEEERRVRRSTRHRRNPKMEDFQVDMDDFTQMRQFWTRDIERDGSSPMLLAQADYFGDYGNEEAPKKRSTPTGHGGSFLTYRDLVRIRRDIESQEDSRESDEYVEKREKREEEEGGCNSEVTTLTVGCSTADRMELQSDCVDDDAITAYSCHGRWFDAEGTQFVIATPLARRSSWSNDNNRPQPYRNSRRLCFMYRENGGVVSLTASPVACQREIPPPQPMLAFNATSIGQCMEDSSSTPHRASYLVTLLMFLCLVTLR
ncbi:uncharacterized protein [Venturia canescens]|uniref:uncharacterized protein n=1 Tax=Venturia canescens TaxID=32260 RepID=UPI001C9C9A67|nr:uncharacterized protein LOC122409151 [Venturia canescens]XP_043272422.1 uncharacterized protein LOC122409151 [Venturia canescens]XP_043272430.1 uncharacterized protein LOC122409151 [Venturia canescens]XP_043272439.1 uncharacterized protein LOC122409151 [Venturia canescens]